MAFLDLSDRSFAATLCSEADSTGSAVAGVALVNLDRVLWIEVLAEADTILFQVDPDRWLRLAFASDREFRAARDRILARCRAGGA